MLGQATLLKKLLVFFRYDKHKEAPPTAHSLPGIVGKQGGECRAFQGPVILTVRDLQ